jgi:hypothetical protein
MTKMFTSDGFGIEGWLTNDVEAATLLRAADAAYSEARLAAMRLPLAAKVEALRAAKHDLLAAYDAAHSIIRGSESND